MKITAIKVYGGRKEFTEIGKPGNKIYGITSIDATIENIQSPEDFDEIIKHLEGWKEELKKSKMVQ